MNKNYIVHSVSILLLLSSNYSIPADHTSSSGSGTLVVAAGASASASSPKDSGPAVLLTGEARTTLSRCLDFNTGTFTLPISGSLTASEFKTLVQNLHDTFPKDRVHEEKDAQLLGKVVLATQALLLHAPSDANKSNIASAKKKKKLLQQHLENLIGAEKALTYLYGVTGDSSDDENPTDSKNDPDFRKTMYRRFQKNNAAADLFETQLAALPSEIDKLQRQMKQKNDEEKSLLEQLEAVRTEKTALDNQTVKLAYDSTMIPQAKRTAELKRARARDAMEAQLNRLTKRKQNTEKAIADLVKEYSRLITPSDKRENEQRRDAEKTKLADIDAALRVVTDDIGKADKVSGVVRYAKWFGIFG